MIGGSHCQCEREKGEGTGSVAGRMGRRLLLLLGRRGSSGSISSFFCVLSFSLFCFSISFISFSNLVQIDSNQFVFFSKIQLNILRQ
jgi:hypothetical protein